MNTNPLTLTYSDEQLRLLVEEFITMQKSEFAMKDVCNYIHYWAVEDGKVTEGKKLVESYELHESDQERLKRILDTIIAEGRIITTSNTGTYRIMTA